MYSPIDLRKKKSYVLVVQCADPRFQAAYRQIIDGIGEYYDLLSYAGASKSIVENQSVLDNIKLLHRLHDFETIHIMDHIECGAFGEIDDEIKTHGEMLQKAAERLEKEIPGIKVTCRLLGEEKELDLRLKRKG